MEQFKELKRLKDGLSEAEQGLKQARSKFDKEKLKDLINEIKLDLGWALHECGEDEKGLAVYLSVLGRQYQERKYNGVATALIELGRYDEAKRVLKYGLRKFPRSCALWTDRGILYDALGDYSEALKCFEVALRVNRGEDSGCLYNKALILVKSGSYGDAVSIIDDLVERFPEDPKYLAERGCCSLEMGYPKEALRYLQRAMGLFKEFPTVDAGVSIFSGLCCAYRELGMKKEAMEIALEGLRTFPNEDPILFHNLGATFYEMGWIKEAREVLRKGVERFPNDRELSQFLNDIEQELDDPDGGVKPFLGLLILALFYKKLGRKW